MSSVYFYECGVIFNYLNNDNKKGVNILMKLFIKKFFFINPDTFKTLGYVYFPFVSYAELIFNFPL